MSTFPSKETIKLLIPLENGIEKLDMRRPKARDLRTARLAGGGDANIEVVLFANLCEVSPDDIDNLDMADYTALQEKYGSFLSSRKGILGLDASS